jgi:TonB family protein
MSLANYVFEVNAGFVFFYGVYWLLLRNETDFNKQRIFLVTGLIGALVFPLIDIPWGASKPVIAQAISVVVLPELIIGAADAPRESFVVANLWFIVYVTVASVIAAPVLLQAVKIYRLFKQHTGRYRDDFYVIESVSNQQSWSFFRLIFIGQADKLSDKEKDLIVKHEMLHGRLRHSLDNILITALCVLCWFNPVVWIYRRTITRIHEFEVDALVANEGRSVDYGILLAKTALTGNGLLLTHHFNQSFILKRINMLNIIKSRVSSWKLAALATTIVIYFIAVACTDQVSDNKVRANEAAVPENINEQFIALKSTYPSRNLELIEVTAKNGLYKLPEMEGKSLMQMFTLPGEGRTWIVAGTSGDKEVFTIVDNSASPAGGMQDFYDKIAGVLQYPDQARKMGVQGKVFVEFTVMEDGKLTDFKVVKGIGAGCDAEALRAVAQMGNWKPGEMNGKPVPQKMVLPITFKL